MAKFLDKKLQTIRGLGLKTAKLLESLDLFTVENLLEHYPNRYEDYRSVKQIAGLKSNEAVTIKAWVSQISTRRARANRRLSITEAILTDESGSISAIWFNQPYLATTLQKGQTYYFAGTTEFRNKLQIRTPQFEEIGENATSVASIIPVYTLPAGISQKRYRSILFNLLSSIPQDYDFLPDLIKDEYKLMDLTAAWKQIHFPKNFDELEKAKQRLSFDELLIFQLKMLQRKKILKNAVSPQIKFDQKKIKSFVQKLPFSLTLAQKKSAWEIIQDLEKSNPMNRLLQGDVGSGKTVVAAMAVFSAANFGFQTAFLAPTEILANQHFKTFKALLSPYDISVQLLTAATKNKEDIYKKVNNGAIDLLLGTHAVLNEKIVFNNLGLIIVDEQHRFGVKQRAQLNSKNQNKRPHLLSMTATPIPRTLALTLYGDLSISTINELPAGRQKIETQVIAPDDQKKAYALMRREILSGRQGFVICPIIDESDVLEVKSATVEKERLAKEVFPNFSVGLVHGRMKQQEREKVMQDFADGEYHILVSTSVIEVGIDIPNASFILIEGAERFGLAQLHQFRGRVGRGKHKSYCLLSPSTPNIPERLHVLQKYNDGFRIAELDLKIRGMGQITGIKQSGYLDTKIADLNDIELIKKARNAAQRMTKESKLYIPELKEKTETEGALHPE